MWPAAIIAAMFMAINVASANEKEVNPWWATGEGDCDGWTIFNNYDHEESPGAFHIEVEDVEGLVGSGGSVDIPDESEDTERSFRWRAVPDEGDPFAWVDLDLVRDLSECAPDPVPGSITIVKDTNPESEDIEFDFDGDFGDFDLEDDQYVVFDDLSAGNYYVQENEVEGFVLADIDCDASVGSSVNIDDSDREVFISLAEGGSVTCTFTNVPVTEEPEPTPVPTQEVLTVIECTDDGTRITTVNGVVTSLIENSSQCPQAEPPSVISPPNTGDGGLLTESESSPILYMAAGLAVMSLGFGLIWLGRRA